MTEAKNATREAKEANRLTRLAQEADESTSAVRAQREERQTRANELTAQAALGAATAAASSSNAVQRANTIAEQGLSAAAERFQLEQRPRLAFDNTEPIVLSLKSGLPLHLVVNIRNIGKTEALAYRQMLRVSIRPPGTVFYLSDYPYVDSTEAKASLAAGSKSTLAADDESPLPRPSLEGLDSRTLVIYVLGEIRYNDVFDKRHRWRFCRVMDAVTGVTTVCGTDLQD